MTLAAALLRAEQENFFEGYFYDAHGRKALFDLPLYCPINLLSLPGIRRAR